MAIFYALSANGLGISKIRSQRPVSSYVSLCPLNFPLLFGILKEQSAVPTWVGNTVCHIPNNRWRQMCDSDEVMAEVSAFVLIVDREVETLRRRSGQPATLILSLPSSTSSALLLDDRLDSGHVVFYFLFISHLIDLGSNRNPNTSTSAGRNKERPLLAFRPNRGKGLFLSASNAVDDT